MLDEATRIGVIEDVSGSTLSSVLDERVRPGLVFVNGRGYRIGQPGSFIRVPLGYADLFGIVSHVGASAVPERLATSEQASRRWMTIQLVGESTRTGEFSRGIAQYPTVGDPIHLVAHDDLVRIYGRPESPQFISIGTIASSESVRALIDVNQLVTRHSAVVGSTGSGKSTAVASLLNSVAATGRFASARVLVLDLHGEYSAAFGDRATVFRVNPDVTKGERHLFVPYWALEFEELQAVTFGGFASDTDRGGVVEYIREAKREALQLTPREGATNDSLSVDTPVPFSIHRVWLELHKLVSSTHTQSANQSLETVAYELDGQGAAVDPGDALQVRAPRCRPQDGKGVLLSHSPLNIRRSLDALAYRLRDSRFNFLFRPGPWLPDENGNVDTDLDSLLQDWLACTRPVTILDLSGIPREVVNILIGVLLRIIYDSMYWARFVSEGTRERPLVAVLEEAHAYLGRDERGPAARMVRRIVREGRKYGIGVVVVSQRPSEIDPTILSQCGTFFSLRLTNSQDRSQVATAAPDNLEGLFSLLPILRTGEAIVAGEAVHIPTRVLIQAPPEDRRPASEDPVVYEPGLPGGWNRPQEPADYAEVVELWRRQDPKSRRIIDFDDEGDAT